MNNQTVFTWPYIFKLALEHKRDVFIANLVSIIATAIYLPVPLIIPSLINEVLLKQPGLFTKVLSYFLPKVWITPAVILISALLLVLILRFCEQCLRVIQGREFKFISKDIVFKIRMKLLSHLQNISIHEYETLGAGKLASYYIKDLDTIDEFLGTTVSSAIIAALFIIGITIVVFIINWKVALFLLIFNPFSIILTAQFAKKLKMLKSKQNNAFELFQDAFVETINLIVQIRADNKETTFIGRLIHKAKQVKDDSIAYEWKTEMVSDFAGIILFIGVDLYYIFCMTLILFHDLTIGMMIALLQYVFQMQWYMKIIVNIQSAFYAADSALTRVNQIMSFTTEPKYIAKFNPFIDNKLIDIQIEQLDFSYLPNKPILTDVNMHIEPGKKIGIVGASGSGKSTLIQILLGFYPISKGQITINNLNFHDIGFELIRENVSAVLQNPILFNDTVRNNLTYGADISSDEIWHALNMAQLGKTVEKFDKQLETQVGKGGVRLSGGQRQRLAIARMLLRNPKVVILDEATSALDSKTEYELFNAINKFLASRTTIIIAHRLSTIIDADKIYVINNGTVTEQGTHHELMLQNGIYYSLYRLQQA